MKASKVIMWVIASPFILIALGIAFCEANKAYWDHQVKLMCEKDGGVTVYEHIELTPEEFKNLGGNQYGQIPIPGADLSAGNKYDYLSKAIETEIKNYGPRVRRMEYIVYRKSDGKDLGKMITYSRIGGDMPDGISSESHFGCADLKTIRLDIEKQIFTVKGE